MTTSGDSPSLGDSTRSQVDEEPKWNRLFVISIVLAAIQFAPLLAWMYLAWMYSLAELTLQAGLWLGLFFTAPVWILVAMRLVTNRLGSDANVYPSHDQASPHMRWEKWVIFVAVLLQLTAVLLFAANIAVVGFLFDDSNPSSVLRWLIRFARDTLILTITTLITAAILSVLLGTVLRVLGCRANAKNLFCASSIMAFPLLFVAIYGNLLLQFIVYDILASFAFGGVFILVFTPAIVGSIAFNSKRDFSIKSQVYVTFALLYSVQFLWIFARLFAQSLAVIY